MYFEVEGDSEKPCLLDKTQKLVSSVLCKDNVRTPNLTQTKQHERENECLTDNISEAKKVKLSECENLTDWQVDIVKGEMLSDIPINIAQSLLKKQFPGLNALQPTVYQQRSQTGESLKDEVNQMQIIHCRGNHWIVSSSIGCIGFSEYL